MFKQAISIVGVLQETASTSALTMQVDNAFASYLRNLLGIGDWTYVAARVGNAVETIKITAIDPSLPIVTVVRGLDGQTLTLAPGQELEFRMLAQAITDMLNVAALAPAIAITGEGAISVVEASPGQFIITAPNYEVTSNDGSLVVSTSTDGNTPPKNYGFGLSVNQSTIGCCTTTSS